MKQVRKRLDDIFDCLPNPLTDNDSPGNLTDLGKEISCEIGTQNWAKRKLESATQQVRNRSSYKTQQYCFDLAMVENLADEEKQKVDSAAYRHGLAVSQILDVLAIELRDLLLTGKQVHDSP